MGHCAMTQFVPWGPGALLDAARRHNRAVFNLHLVGLRVAYNHVPLAAPDKRHISVPVQTLSSFPPDHLPLPFPPPPRDIFHRGSTGHKSRTTPAMRLMFSCRGNHPLHTSRRCCNGMTVVKSPLGGDVCTPFWFFLPFWDPFV